MVVLMLIQISHLNLRPGFSAEFKLYIIKDYKRLNYGRTDFAEWTDCSLDRKFILQIPEARDASYGFLRTEKFCKCMGMPYYKNKEKRKKNKQRSVK